MACQFRGMAPVTAVVFVLHTCVGPVAAAASPALGASSGRPGQAPDTVQVSVCIARAIVDLWDHTDRDSRMSAFKDYAAEYIEGAHNTRVQYRVTAAAFASFDPAAPDPRAMFELVDAGQPCPANMEEYTVPVV